MTNTSVNNVVTNSFLLTLTSRNDIPQKKTYESPEETKFSSFLNSESTKQQIQESTVVQKKDMKNPDGQENSFENMTETTDDSKSIDDTDTKQQMVIEEEDSLQDCEEVQMVQKTFSKDEEEVLVDDETMEIVAEAVIQLLHEAAEILEVSEEELLTLLQENDFCEWDLLNPDTMVKLALAAEGEDSVIGIVMNEDIYQNLQSLMTEVDKRQEWISEQTDLSQEELQTVLKQIKALEEEQPSVEEVLNVSDEEMPVLVKMAEIDDRKLENVENSMEQTPEKMILETAKTELKTVKPEQSEDGKQHSMQNGQQQNLFQTLQENLEKIQEVKENVGMTTDSAPSPENILKQLVDFVKIQTGKEMTQMEFELHPASLGTVNIQLATKGGVVTAQLSTENETVKHAIETHIADLRSNLEEQGIKVEAIEVTVSSHQMEKNLEQGKKEGQQKENNSKTEGIKKTRRASINLNDWINQEEEEQDMTSEEIESTRLAREMMAIQGGTMDVLA